MSEIRQTHRELTFVEVVRRPRMHKGKLRDEKYARLTCSCGARLTIQLSRWKNEPPSSCKKCALKRIKRMGRGIFHHAANPPMED